MFACFSRSSLRSATKGDEDDDVLERSSAASPSPGSTQHGKSNFSSYSWKKSKSSFGRSSPRARSSAPTPPTWEGIAADGQDKMEPVMERTRSALTDLEAVKFLIEDWSHKQWRPATPMDQERFDRLEQSDIKPLVALGEGGYGSVNLCRIAAPGASMAGPGGPLGDPSAAKTTHYATGMRVSQSMREMASSGPSASGALGGAGMTLKVPVARRSNPGALGRTSPAAGGGTHAHYQHLRPGRLGQGTGSGAGKGVAGASRLSLGGSLLRGSSGGSSGTCVGTGEVDPGGVGVGASPSPSPSSVKASGVHLEGMPEVEAEGEVSLRNGVVGCSGCSHSHSVSSPVHIVARNLDAAGSSGDLEGSVPCGDDGASGSGIGRVVGEAAEAREGETVDPGEAGVSGRSESCSEPQLIVAVKRVPLGWNQERELMQLHRCQSCPFIVRLFGFVEDGAEHCSYVMEWAEGGDLGAVLSSLKDRRGANKSRLLMSEAAARYYTACLLLALEFLHTNGLLHRDIKPSNLLLTSDGTAKLADLGFTVALDANGTTVGCCGTTGYIAPEVYAYGNTKARVGYGIPADIWSTGATLYQMLVGSVVTEKPEEVLKKGWRPPTHPQFSRELQDLLNRLLAPKPNHRPQGVASVMRHAWFAGFDWAALRAGRMLAPYVPSERRGANQASSPASALGGLSPTAATATEAKAASLPSPSGEPPGPPTASPGGARLSTVIEPPVSPTASASASASHATDRQEQVPQSADVHLVPERSPLSTPGEGSVRRGREGLVRDGSSYDTGLDTVSAAEARVLGEAKQQQQQQANGTHRAQHSRHHRQGSAASCPPNELLVAAVHHAHAVAVAAASASEQGSSEQTSSAEAAPLASAAQNTGTSPVLASATRGHGAHQGPVGHSNLHHHAGDHHVHGGHTVHFALECDDVNVPTALAAGVAECA